MSSIVDSKPTAPRIQATQFSLAEWRWLYAMDDGTIVRGEAGAARIPAGLPITDRIQWAANQILPRPV